MIVRSYRKESDKGQRLLEDPDKNTTVKTHDGDERVVHRFAEGRTVGTKQRSFSHGDRDQIAIYWDEEDCQFKEHTYQTTRFASDPFARAEVDAQDPYDTYWAWKRYVDKMIETARSFLDKLSEDLEGSTVVFDEDGEEGRVFWTGESKYPPHQARVGVDVTPDSDDRTVRWADRIDVTLKSDDFSNRLESRSEDFDEPSLFRSIVMDMIGFGDRFDPRVDLDVIPTQDISSCGTSRRIQTGRRLDLI